MLEYYSVMLCANDKIDAGDLLGSVQKSTCDRGVIIFSAMQLKMRSLVYELTSCE